MNADERVLFRYLSSYAGKAKGRRVCDRRMIDLFTTSCGESFWREGRETPNDENDIASTAEGGDTNAELQEAADRIARSGVPAIYIDTWFLTTWRGHMRLTFGETVSRVDAYRSAIVLELRDAEKLANQMLKMIERRRAREQEDRPGDTINAPAS